MLLAGRPVDSVAGLVGELARHRPRPRADGPRAIAWNPTAAWTEATTADVRAHLAYMAVDMPAGERARLGLDDERTARLREIVTTRGPEAAGPLIPDALLDRYAVTGSRATVVARLSGLASNWSQPELVLFEADDYSVAYLESAAAVALDAGARIPLKMT